MWQSVAEYFESTSIHGFSHLRASKTLLGRLLWILIIGSCFSLAALLICESIDEANDNPILTNIETISVQDIPFPAVTINTAKPNVWRHFAKILNGLKFDQQVDQEELPEDSRLVKKVSPILDKVLGSILEKYQPNENFSPDVIAAFAKIYANYPEKEINLKIKSDLKKLLLLCPGPKPGYDPVKDFITTYFMGFIQQYPMNENSSESSEANTKKAARIVPLVDDSIQEKCSRGTSKYLGFGDFLVYFKHELLPWSDELEKTFMEFYQNVSIVKDNEKLKGLMKVNELVTLLATLNCIPIQ